MRKEFSKVAFSWGIIASVFFLGAGCRTIIETGDEVDVRPDPPPEAEEEARVETGVTKLNVAVESEPRQDEEIATVTERVDNRIQSRLAASGFNISSGAPDLRVALGVDTELFDKLGSTYRYKGEVRTEVRRLFDNRLLGRQSFAVEGERAHSRGDALHNLADELADNAGNWLVSTCTDGAAGLKVEVVTIRRRHLLDRADSEYAEMFIQTVSDIDGVASCELIERDHGDRRMAFRVVYFTEKLPAGLLNRLVTIDDLKLKPGN